MPIDPNAPAFPTVTHEAPGEAPIGTYVTTGDRPGMSIRCWLAGQALMGWAAGRNNGADFHSSDPDHVAVSCRRYADAVVADLNKNT